MIILEIARGRSSTAATSKVELFVTIFNGSKPLTIITKSSILDVAAVLDLPLIAVNNKFLKNGNQCVKHVRIRGFSDLCIFFP